MVPERQRDSQKNAEIAMDPAIALLFQGSVHADFLRLIGRASIVLDRAVIKSLCKPVLKTWLTEGEDDPRITAIKIKPQSGYYWDNKHGAAVAGVKMLIGAAIGKTLDDSIEGTVRHLIVRWRASPTLALNDADAATPLGSTTTIQGP